MAEVALRNVVKRFDDVEVVRNISLDIPDNEFVVLVGPSGCGKSTTLRMIAGLEEITAGDIYIGGEVVNDLPPKDRDIAMVFQNYALYPHMTVFENMSFGLKLRKFPKDEIKKRVDHAARILDITELLDRKPKALSGGQRQRVAMGRAIVRNPKVFLFDEPLSNLDAKLRVQMRTEIKRVHQLVKTTTVYVTHDQVEAMTLADRVVVMNGGVDRADRHAAGALPSSEDAVRRRLHRLAGDEFHALPGRAERRRACACALSDTISLPVPAAQSARYQPADRQGADVRAAAGAHHRAAAQRQRSECEFARHARRGRADGHGDDGLFHRRRPGSLRPRRSRQRHRPRRADAALRQHGPHAPDRSAERRCAVSLCKPASAMKNAGASPPRRCHVQP